MNNHSKTIISLIAVLSLVVLNNLVTMNRTLANSEPTVPINDGARHLRGLETDNSHDWDFVSQENNPKTSNYQLRIYKPEVRLVERKEPEWSNTGEQPNYSVLLEVYDFSEDAAE